MFEVGYEVRDVDELLEMVKKNGPWKTVKTRKGRKFIDYVNLPCSFDIETSSFYVGEVEQGTMYIWQLGINGYVITGRTWEQFFEALYKIKKFFSIDLNKRLVIYVHNLSFEFAWFYNYFEWNFIFAREERSPFKAVTEEGFEFRDSYILSGASLEVTGTMLTKYKVQKMVGDLDYSLIRHSETPLTDKEKKYAINDVLVVMAYIQEQIEQYGDITKIPMTNTGRVRKYCQEHCLSSSKYVNLINSLKINDTYEYDMLKLAFSGGFTHANYRKAGKTFTGKIAHKDITSSYPTQMIARSFPMSTGEYIEVESLEDLKSNFDDYCCIFNIKFTNIVEKATAPDHYISESKCHDLLAPVVDNGRIISAHEATVTITDVDLFIIENVYEWDNVEIGTVIRYKRDYLPAELIECILDFYEKKTTLKGVDGSESIYQLFKGMLNSIYGCACTDILSSEISFEDSEWHTDKVENWSEETKWEKIDHYNNDRKRFLFYPWAIYVCAYGRLQLWEALLSIGCEDQIYSDTDSTFYLHPEKHEAFFEEYNKWIVEQLESVLEYRGIATIRVRPKNKKDIAKPLGIWDNEEDIVKYKTLGAKRYLCEFEDGKIECTISGANKKKTSQWLSTYSNPFDIFDDNMVVPKFYSGRNIVSYFDAPCSGEVVDYRGVKAHYRELSYVHMRPTEYSLTMSDAYLNLLNGKILIII